MYCSICSTEKAVRNLQINRSGILEAAPPLRILDNACGPAVLTELMYDDLSQKYPNDGDFTIVCADVGTGMIDISKQKIENKGWKGVTAKIIDQNDLSELQDGAFTHILTGLGINFVKDADNVLKGVCEVMHYYTPRSTT